LAINVVHGQIVKTGRSSFVRRNLGKNQETRSALHFKIYNTWQNINYIDDEVKLRESNSRNYFFFFSGYEVIAAENGLEALQKCCMFSLIMRCYDANLRWIWDFMESHVASSYSHIQ
jgi:hypothetical protein